MDYTKGFKTANGKIGLDARERAMADLTLMGWKGQDAYVLIYGPGAAYSDEWHKQKMKEIVDREVFANYIMKAKKKADKEASKAVDNAIQEEFDSIDAARQMSKEDVMSELVRIAFKMPANDPKRADILMKYADLTQMKKDEVDKEEKTVHTYLPLTCKDCPLYVKHKRRQNG